MAIKKLQNNFTTPEQSKRLLELGMPVYTSDCYYEAIGFNQGYEQTPQICTNGKFGINIIDLPCWSTGRLIEIYFICSCQPEILIDYTIDDLVDYLVGLFKSVVMNFSKLEK